MPFESSTEDASTRATAELSKLRAFTGTPAEFWQKFLLHAAELIGAPRAVLALKESKPQANGGWKKFGEHAGNGLAHRSVGAFVQSLVAIADRCVLENAAVHLLERSALPGKETLAIGLKLQLSKQEEVCVAIFLLVEAGEASARVALSKLQLLADIPLSYLQNQAMHQARTDVEKFAESLDLLAQLDSEKHFLSAALAFCNALATRHHCERVSLGWLSNQYVKLRAISRTERFDRNMSVAKALEVAMEEALDQDEEIVWPRPEGLNVVTRDHAIFAREQAIQNICSIPIRADDKAAGVLTCERQQGAFSSTELQQFRLACDRASRRLTDLERRDRWFGARVAAFTREKIGKVFGPEHTWLKVITLLGCAALIVLFFVPFPYRVEGKFILRSDDVTYLTAPFDGYIREVAVRPGDVLKKEGVLLKLDTNDLELEEAATLAEQNRYLREAEKARAARSLAEMRIAEALAEQASARLSIARHRLSQATLKSPFEGVVTEGDLRERIGAPIKQGESLFKVARINSLYVEAEINENDIHDLRNGASGEIGFVSQPKLKYPIRVTRIEPAAFPKSNENVFMIRCSFEKEIQDWWRPGMSGLCKLDVEKRTLFWILTHRTVDLLRLWLWW